MQRTLPAAVIPLLSLFLLSSPPAPAASFLFQESFDDPQATNAWTFVSSSTDYQVEFGFDYSTTTYTYQAKAGGPIVTNLIPPAPRSSPGTNKAFRVTVNKNDSIPAAAGISAYPTTPIFSGNYFIRFDLWMNYSGNIGGGPGSTEFANFGINHSGTNVNWNSPITPGDGLWFAVSGENGAARDYRLYQFDLDSNRSTELLYPSEEAGLIADDPFQDPLPSRPEKFRDRFPSPPFENPGCIGKRWVEVEISQVDNVITWKINGFVIAQRTNSTSFTEGHLMLGYMDVFSSIASPPNANFALFDNLRVLRLDDQPRLARVTASVADAEGDEGSGDTITFTVSRAGSDLTNPLEVAYRMSGTATEGVDYSSTTGKVIIPAGKESAEVRITPLNDSMGENTESVELVVIPAPGYEVYRNIRADASLTDRGDPASVTITAKDPWAYEGFPDDTASLVVERTGDESIDLTVQFKIEGSASNGSDYETIGSSIIIPAGSTFASVEIRPINDNLFEPDEMVQITLLPGANYVISDSNQAAVTLRDDDPPEGEIITRIDDFDSDTSANWNIVFTSTDNTRDLNVQFGFDYGALGIPLAPHSPAGANPLGLFLQVNKDLNPAAAAVNLFLQRPTPPPGDYIVRFDMFLSFGSGTGSTEHAIFGLNHSGTGTNSHGLPGTDGLWFAVETDGSASSGRSYVSYFSTNSSTAPTFTAQSASLFTPYFTRPPYLAAGTPSGQWVEVELSHSSNQVVWSINHLPIATVPTTNAHTGTIMLGHMDDFASLGSTNNFVLYDNLRLITATPLFFISSFKQLSPNSFELTFSSAQGLPSNFTVESALSPRGPYAALSNIPITSAGDHTFKAIIPTSLNGRSYFRISQPTPQ